jgi:hypothetical protein
MRTSYLVPIQRCKSLMLDQKVHVCSDRTELEESLGTQTTCASGRLATASPARIKCSFNYLSEINLKNLFLYKRYTIYFNILDNKADQKTVIRFHRNVNFSLWNYLEQSVEIR